MHGCNMSNDFEMLCSGAVWHPGDGVGDLGDSRLAISVFPPFGALTAPLSQRNLASFYFNNSVGGSIHITNA